MPKRAASRLALALLAACAGGAPEPPAAEGGAAAPLCTRGPSTTAGDLDLSAGTWRVLRPPHGNGEFGLPMQIDAVFDACDAIVSLAHDVGPGGKAGFAGPGRLLLSADGSTWEPRELSSAAYFHDIARSDRAWVATGTSMGAGVISVSAAADASSWREAFTHSESFRAVAFGGGKFVAVTRAGLAVSSDGERWGWARIPGTQALYSDVAYGAGRFVVAGVGATLTSSDAERWEEVSCPGGCPAIQPPTGPALTHIALQQVRFVGGYFYAFGASGYLRSSDGRAFERFGGDRIPAAAIGGKLISLRTQGLIAGDGGELLAESSDGGRTWTALPLEAIVEQADCGADACIASDGVLLVFHPTR